MNNLLPATAAVWNVSRYGVVVASFATRSEAEQFQQRLGRGFTIDSDDEEEGSSA